MRALTVSVALTAFLLAGCANEAPPVDWGGKYSTTVKKRLDELVAKKDCEALQAELTTAHTIDAAKKRLYGSGSADLVAYIEWGLAEADCEAK
jgi:outer membrane murein-binding lipoprotein Lpp